MLTNSMVVYHLRGNRVLVEGLQKKQQGARGGGGL